jgi:hypothetical protein
VQYVTVTFTAPSTGPSASFQYVSYAITNALGVATSTTVFANGIPGGPYSVTATVPGVTTPATFNLTNSPGVGVVPVSGSNQSAATNTTFVAPLVVQVVDPNGNPVKIQNYPVVFAAPPNTASATFVSGAGTSTVMADANGQATSPEVWANGTAGGPYEVTATAQNLPTVATFDLTNVTPAAANQYVLAMAGLESGNYGTNSYALDGAVKIDANGYVLAGEEDYKDDYQTSSPEPSGATITGGALNVSAATGQGTLTLVTNDPVLGSNGVETLGVQFVNAKHALVIQFDGTATSSGSLDFQTLPGEITGNFAFTLSGGISVQPADVQETAGGVLSINGPNLTGTYDYVVGGLEIGNVTFDQPLAGTISAPDSFGRGAIALPNTSLPSTLNYYVVGQEVLRLIGDGAGFRFDYGAALGQGTNAGSFGNQSLGSSVFGLESNAFTYLYSAAGMFTTNPASGSFQGAGDVNEVGLVGSGVSISGSYSIGSNGYGSMTIEPGQLQDISMLGIYMVDPNLNIADPNNTSTGLGGALVAELDPYVYVIGTGFLVPQTDTSASSFSGNYVFGAQQFNAYGQEGWETDFIGQADINSGDLNGTALYSDPSGYYYVLNATYTGVTYAGTATPDASNLGRYAFAAPNYLSITVPAHSLYNTWTDHYDVVVYQASGDFLFWIDDDRGGQYDLFLGTLQRQGSLNGLPGAK